MMATERKPLLSICVPTYNRSRFLRVMLQALLPQVRACGDEVEVWVLDNSSTDNTQQVLQESQQLGPFQVKRQTSNIGPARNIVDGPVTTASGEFVWVLGDHNLMRPDAISRILECLRGNHCFDTFYVNFLCASYPNQWPDSAVGGFSGPTEYCGNPEIRGGKYERWFDLIQPISAACTQNYVHIVRRRVWCEFWKGRELATEYTSAITSYPHTVTISMMAGQNPCFAISDPSFTIFNGAQSWGNITTRAKVYFTGLPELLKLYKTLGVPPGQLKRLWNEFHRPEATRVIVQAVSELGIIRGSFLIMKHLGLHFQGWLTFFSALARICFPGPFRLHDRLRTWSAGYKGWYLMNFRPARWIRNRLGIDE